MLLRKRNEASNEKPRKFHVALGTDGTLPPLTKNKVLSLRTYSPPHCTTDYTTDFITDCTNIYIFQLKNKNMASFATVRYRYYIYKYYMPNILALFLFLPNLTLIFLFSC